MKHRILVTGANGHVGTAIMAALSERGDEAIALVHRPAVNPALEALGIKTIVGDVLQPETLAPAMNGITHVIHCAAVISIDGDPDGLVIKTNTEGPRNVARAALAAGAARFVHVSSIHAFRSQPEWPLLDETAPRPGDDSFAYDRSKLAGETEIRNVIAEGLDAVILNPTGIIGPFDHGTSHGGKMLRGLFEGTLPSLVNAGFDWVDARDVAGAAISALEKGTSGENYIVAGRYVAFAELAAICEKISGIPAPRFSAPIWAARLGLPFLRGWTRLTGLPPLYTHESLTILEEANRNISSAKAERELGYSARDLGETIRDSYRWYTENG